MYDIQITSRFKKRYKKLTEKNKKLENIILKTLRLLRTDPGYKSLRTHKIFISSFGEVYSSYVTGDLRIIWMQVENKLIILLLDIGGHSGSTGVYR